jgi:hypothetical protein
VLFSIPVSQPNFNERFSNRADAIENLGDDAVFVALRVDAETVVLKTMAAGLTDKLMTWEDLVDIIDAFEPVQISN